MPAVNESNLRVFDLSHAGATSFCCNWNLGGIYAGRGGGGWGGEMVVAGGQEQEDMLGSTSTDPQLSLAPD